MEPAAITDTELAVVSSGRGLRAKFHQSPEFDTMMEMDSCPNALEENSEEEMEVCGFPIDSTQPTILPQTFCNISFLHQLSALDDSINAPDESQDDLSNDVVFRIGTYNIPAKKRILAKRSKYFRSMFESGYKEKDACEIEMFDVSPSLFKTLLQYFYEGVIELNVNNVFGLHKLADMFDIPEIGIYCVEYYKSFKITSENCFECLAVGLFYSASVLVEHASRVYRKLFNSLSKTDQFRALPRHVLEHIIKDAHLAVKSEEHVCSALLSWLKVSPERWQHMDLFDSIILHDLRPNYLNHLLHIPSVMESVELTRKITVIKAYLCSSLSENLELPSQNIRIKSYRGCVFIAGGGMTKYRDYFHSGCLVFRPGWEETASMSKIQVINGEVAACLLKSWVYVSGAGHEMNEIWKCNITKYPNSSWTFVCKQAVSREMHNMVVTEDDSVYILGGHTVPSSVKIRKQTQKCEKVYQVERMRGGACEVVGKLLISVVRFGTVCDNNCIYVFGGHRCDYCGPDTNKDMWQWSAFVQKYDCNTNQCSMLSAHLPMQHYRTLLDCQVVDYGSIVVILCKDKIFKLPKESLLSSGVTECDNFEGKPKVETKTRIPNLKLMPGVNMDRFKAHILGDSVYLIGGRIVVEKDRSKIYTCKIRTAKLEAFIQGWEIVDWQVIATLPEPRFAFGSVSVKQLATGCIKRLANSVDWGRTYDLSGLFEECHFGIDMV